MMTESHFPVDGIPEESVAAILARAAELDRSRRETISVDALRTAALDAGINAAALEAALDEYAAGKALAPAVPETKQKEKPRFARLRSLFGALKTPLKLAGFFLLFGLTAGVGEEMAIIAYFGWLTVSAWLIYRNRPSRKVRHFATGEIFMTLGLALGFAAANVDEDIVASLFLLGAPILALGSAIIKVRLPERFRRSGGELEAPAN